MSQKGGEEDECGAFGSLFLGLLDCLASSLSGRCSTTFWQTYIKPHLPVYRAIS